MNNPTVLDDGTALVTIRNFLAAEKPHALSPLDIGIMVHLLSRKAEDHEVYDSHLKMAEMFNTDIRTISRAMARLEEVGYISQRRRKGKTSLISVQYENVPSLDILRTKITDDARRIAKLYKDAVVSLGRKKFPKNWFAQQFLSAQRILNNCNGDFARAGVLIAHAFESLKYRKKAMKSLYNVAAIWPALVRDYAKEQAAIEARKQAKERKEHAEPIGISATVSSTMADSVAAA